MIANLDLLIEAVKSQMQPPGRAMATTGTLQELSIFIPDDVTLADLVIGWRTLSHPSRQAEEIAIERRRITCGELAELVPTSSIYLLFESSAPLCALALPGAINVDSTASFCSVVSRMLPMTEPLVASTSVVAFCKKPPRLEPSR